MKKYIHPELLLEEILVQDILTLSVGNGDGDSDSFNDLFVQA